MRELSKGQIAEIVEWHKGGNTWRECSYAPGDDIGGAFLYTGRPGAIRMRRLSPAGVTIAKLEIERAALRESMILFGFEPDRIEQWKGAPRI